MKHFILAAMLIIGLAGQAHAYGPYVGFSISTGVPLPPPPPVYYGYPAPAPGYYPGYGHYRRHAPPPYYYRQKHHHRHRNWN